MADADSATGGAQSPKKERSPSFPYIGLTKSLERARELYSHAKRHEARMADAATAWGLGAKSSATQQTVGALLAFGLIEDSGSGEARKLKISDIAFKALEDQRPGAKQAALAEAAVKPRLVAEYAERWKGGRPADSICISELRIDGGFTEDGATVFLRVFDDAMQYMRRSGSDAQSDSIEKGVDVKVGDIVQWTSIGIDQLPKPLPVTRISDDQQWAWVAGSNTGIPMSEISIVGPASKGSNSTPPRFPQFDVRDGHTPAGYREEKFALREGDVTVRFPDNLSVDSVGDLEAYIGIMIRKARREAGGA